MSLRAGDRCTLSAMCGRFAILYKWRDVQRLLRLTTQREPPAGFAQRYNVAPRTQVPIVRLTSTGERECALVRWGLVPTWVKDIADLKSDLINARVETVSDKPSFRSAFRARRCVVPASGFYEWKKTGVDKQPHYIHPQDGSAILCFAGLWEQWRSPTGICLESCVILTRDATPALSDIHPRMPVALKQDAVDTWLDRTNEDVAALRDLARSAACPILTFHPVSSRVNSVRHDDADCIKPIDEDTLFS